MQAMQNEGKQTLIDDYVYDNYKDSAVNLMLENNKIQQAIGTMIKYKDITNAQSLINSFTNERIKSIFNISLKYQTNGRTIKKISSTDSVTITGLAIADDIAGGYARTMCKAAFGRKYALALPAIPSLTSARQKERIINYTDILPETAFAVYPNPAADVLHIINYNKNNINLSYQIHDLSGQLIKQINNLDYLQHVELDLNGIAPGAYILNITQNNKTIYNEKIAIAK
jgi:Secretion system C-terminal sorting domain